MTNKTIENIAFVLFTTLVFGSIFGLLAFDDYCQVALNNSTGFIGCATKF